MITDRITEEKVKLVDNIASLLVHCECYSPSARSEVAAYIMNGQLGHDPEQQPIVEAVARYLLR